MEAAGETRDAIKQTMLDSWGCGPAESQAALCRLMDEELLRDAKLLVFANKQDLPVRKARRKWPRRSTCTRFARESGAGRCSSAVRTAAPD